MYSIIGYAYIILFQLLLTFFCWTQCIGKLTGFSSPIIHVFNKTAGSITNNRIPKRPNVLLLGDSTGDVHMADGQLGTVLRIGFLNESIGMITHSIESLINSYSTRGSLNYIGPPVVYAYVQKKR
ncbi:unnamed protein product [Schistosoma margrebowiei]|uniref:5'-nucleotidase n=1 Tax=Schistosoma margrebowiei TaxID=48269 RepID=A0A183M760_9TREM|nr:unnamed protein product [Schistosoma margrebowiei]